MNEENGNGGSLSSGGRFKRMEEALLRIEDKLERKVDVEQLAAHDVRLVALEAGTTPMSKLLLEQFHKMGESVEKLNDEGSHNAQEAERLVHELQKEVLELKTDQIRRATITRVLAVAGGTLAVLSSAAVSISALAG